MNKQIDALKSSAAARSDQAMERSLNAIECLQKNDLPLNFKAVANLAKVPTVYLYKHPELRQKIEQLRDKSEIMRRTANLQKALTKRDAHIVRLETKLKKRDEAIAKLKEQLEVVYGELYKIDGK